MKRAGAALAATMIVTAQCCFSAPAVASPVAGSMVLDDFSGPAGAPPNPDLWTIDVGSSAEHGWEQGSLETYTDKPDNVRLDGEGHLILEARRSGGGYTSGRIVTRDKMAFGLGTITARIKMPAGQGIWPAFWMLGSDIDTVGWPECGEIDIMEIVNDATTYNVSLHAPNAKIGQSGPIPDLSADFHTYWMTRRTDSIVVGVDEGTLATFSPESLPPDAPWVFNGPMFVLLNVAVGGDWPGPPNESTVLPQAMTVDWVRFDPLH